MKTVEKLYGPFEKIARSQSKSWDIKIIACENEIKTTGEIIYFPWNCEDIEGIPFQVLNGYLDHEVAHIIEEREHKFRGLKTPIEIIRNIKDSLLSLTFNVVEDIRIEIKRSKLFAGIGENLKATSIYSVNLLEHKKDDLDKYNLFLVYFLTRARDVGCEWISSYIKDLMNNFTEEIEESKNLKNGRDSFELASRIYKKYQELAPYERKEEEEEEEEEEEGEERGEGDGDSKGSCVCREVSGVEKEGSVEEGGERGECKEGEEEGGKEKGGEEDEGEEKEGEKVKKKFVDFMEVLREKVKEESEMAMLNDFSYIPNPHVVAMDKWVVPNSFPSESYSKIKKKMDSQIILLKNKLLRVIKSRELSARQFDRRSGILDSSSLYKIQLNDLNVFSRQVKGEVLDTAIELLVDLSGSMSSSHREGSKANHARLSVITLAETFDSLGIPFEVIGFYNKRIYVKEDSGKYYINRLPFEFVVYKNFEEKFIKVKNRFVGITGYEENVDGEALFEVAKRISNRPEKRKIIFVFSDGHPSCPGLFPSWSDDYVNYGAKHLEKVIKQVRDSGIYLFGIGITNRSILEFYGSEFSIVFEDKDMDKFALGVFKVVGKILEGK